MIDILIPNFDDFGAQRVAINAANGLKRRGYEVRFVVNNSSGPFQSYLDSNIEILDLGAKVFNIPKVRVLLWLLAYIASIPKNKTCVLISFSPSANLYVLLAKMLRPGVRVIIQEHAFQSVALDDNSFLYRIFYRNFLVKLYRKADIFLTIANAIKNNFIETFSIDPKRAVVVRNPVDVEKIKKMSASEIPSFSFDYNKKYIISAGRLCRQKNFHRLIRIFGNVAHDESNAELIILGEGDDRGSLRKLSQELGIEKRIHFVGFQDNPYAWFSKSHIFCLTSNWEGLPQVIAEAMICGLPVISHDCPSGPAEMLQDGENGFLVRFGDENGFVMAIKKLLNDQYLMEKFGHRAYQLAASCYSIDLFVDDYEKLVNKLIKESGAN